MELAYFARVDRFRSSAGMTRGAELRECRLVGLQSVASLCSNSLSHSLHENPRLRRLLTRNAAPAAREAALNWIAHDERDVEGREVPGPHVMVRERHRALSVRRRRRTRKHAIDVEALVQQERRDGR